MRHRSSVSTFICKQKYKPAMIFKTTQEFERNEIYLHLIANYKNYFQIKSIIPYCQFQIINLAA